MDRHAYRTLTNTRDLSASEDDNQVYSMVETYSSTSEPENVYYDVSDRVSWIELKFRSIIMLLTISTTLMRNGEAASRDSLSDFSFAIMFAACTDLQTD